MSHMIEPPCLIGGCDTSPWFPGVFADDGNGFVSAMEWFQGFCRDETASRVRYPRNSVVLAHGAKHNAAKRNMIAWRRCVSMLDTEIPSKGLSAGVAPRFDAAQPYLGKPPVVTGGAGVDPAAI